MNEQAKERLLSIIQRYKLSAGMVSGLTAEEVYITMVLDLQELIKESCA